MIQIIVGFYIPLFVLTYAYGKIICVLYDKKQDNARTRASISSDKTTGITLDPVLMDADSNIDQQDGTVPTHPDFKEAIDEKEPGLRKRKLSTFTFEIVRDT